MAFISRKNSKLAVSMDNFAKTLNFSKKYPIIDRGLRNAYNASHDVSAGYGGGGYSNSGVANAILNQLKKRDKKDQQGQDAGAAKDEAKKDQNTIQQLLGLLSSGGGRGGLKSSDGTEVQTNSFLILV